MSTKVKMIVTLFVAMAVVSTAGIAVADWSLSGDMQTVSNPSPDINGATWTYICGGGPCGTAVSGDLAGKVNLELPNAGEGWAAAPGHHQVVVKYSVDNDPFVEGGPADDKTNFKAGLVGGHSALAATWTSTTASGTYNVSWLGYNARTQDGAWVLGHEKGRSGPLVIKHNDTVIDQVTLTGGVEDGYDNAYTGSATLNIAAGDTITASIGGGEWFGLDLSVAVPEPTSAILVLTGLAMLGLVRRRR